MTSRAESTLRLTSIGARRFSVGAFWAWLQLVLETRRQRQALLALDHRMLKDIGLSGADAYREASRPLFDVQASRSPRRRG